ncbi:MAG: hypothetical protein ACJ8FY_05625 [Gemmataceae bacterium]
MNTQPAPKGNPVPRKEPARRIDHGTGQGKSLPLRFRYFSVMRTQRIFPLTVEVPDGASAVLANANTLAIKPSIPGAFVEPHEQILDASKPKNSVTFQVTPVAKGKIPGALVKVFQHGRLLQDIPVRMKSTTQRLTWLLAVLTILLPLGAAYMKEHPLRGQIPREGKPPSETAVSAAAAQDKPKEEAKKDGAVAENDKDKADNEKKEAAPAGRRNGAAAAGQPGGGRRGGPGGAAGGGPGGGRGGALRPPAEPGGSNPSPPQKQMYGVTSGQYLEYLVKKSLYDALPEVPYVVKSEPATVLNDRPSDALSWLAWSIGSVYEYLCIMENLVPVVFALMLGLTTLSWVMHKNRQKNLKKSVTLTAEPRLEARHTSTVRAPGHEETIPLADPID